MIKNQSMLKVKYLDKNVIQPRFRVSNIRQDKTNIIIIIL